MMTKGMKQVAAMAAVALLGLAVIDEITTDYIRFRANSLACVQRAQEIAAEMGERLGYLVVVIY